MTSKKSDKPLALYTRVSHQGNRSDDELLSHDLQEKRIREYAESRGLKVSKIRFEDTDVSGGKMSRKGLDEVLAGIQRGEYGGIIVARLTRFARSLEGGLRVIRQTEKLKGEFVACDADFDTTTPMGKAMQRVALTFAELELDTVRAGTEQLRKSKVDQGHYVSGSPPAGYSKEIVGTRKDGKPIYGGLVPNEHAPAVTAAIELRAAGGSWKDVAEHLTAAGVPTSRGNTRWSLIAASQLCRNRAYLGEISNGGITKTDVDGDKYVTDVYFKGGAHKALVSLAIFEAAQARRMTRVLPDRDGLEDALLRGFIRCGTCGNRLVRDHLGGGTRKKLEFYRCKNDGACEAKVVISRNKIDPYVTKTALDYLGELEYENVEGDDVDVAALETAMREVEAEKTELAERLKTGALKAASAVVLMAALESREDEIRSALQEAPEEVIREAVFMGATGVADTFERMTIADKRKVLGVLIERVLIRPGAGKAEERASIAFKPLDRKRHGLKVSDETWEFLQSPVPVPPKART